MTTSDAEIKTSGTRGDKETGEHGLDSNQHRGTGQAGSQTGSQSFSINRNDWSWANSLGQRGQAIVGGMFNRLITKTRDQIGEAEGRIVELRKELQELEDLFEQFQEEVENFEGSK